MWKHPAPPLTGVFTRGPAVPAVPAAFYKGCQTQRQKKETEAEVFLWTNTSWLSVMHLHGSLTLNVWLHPLKHRDTLAVKHWWVPVRRSWDTTHRQSNVSTFLRKLWFIAPVNENHWTSQICFSGTWGNVPPLKQRKHTRSISAFQPFFNDLFFTEKGEDMSRHPKTNVHVYVKENLNPILLLRPQNHVLCFCLSKLSSRYAAKSQLLSSAKAATEWTHGEDFCNYILHTRREERLGWRESRGQESEGAIISHRYQEMAGEFSIFGF